MTVSPPPPDPYTHLAELISLLRGELRNAIGDIKVGLGSKVAVETYLADRRASDQALDALREDIRDIKANKTEEARERRADRRGVILALVGAALSLVIGLILAAVNILV